MCSQHHRPEAEVLLVSESVLDGQVEGFAPHLLVRNDGGGGVPEELLEGVVCRAEVLYTDSMATRVSLAGDGSYTIEDACIDDLLAIVDEALRLASRSGTEGAPRGRAASPSIPLRRPPPRRGSPRW